jgi:uncharacterized protein YcbK (DUF882 family)
LPLNQLISLAKEQSCRSPHSRRLFLADAARLVIVGAALPLAKPALAALPNARSLEFDHTHTGERLSVVFAIGDRYLPEGLQRLNFFLRDHYSGEIGSIDPQLFDLLFQLRQELGCEQPFQIISGYRCAQTNARLRSTVAVEWRSRACTCRARPSISALPACPLADLRDAAMSQGAGGVGFYPDDQFVHLDTGRVRSW